MPAEPRPWPTGVGRQILDTVDSTNAEALRQAGQLDLPTWFLARAQSAGRGRRARAWASPAGNFHASLLCFPEGPAAEVALRSFTASLALRAALVALTGLEAAFTLKWPNDVLLNGGKLAGILLESQGAPGGGVAHLAVGIGVNLIVGPDPAVLEPDATPPVTLLAETGLRISPETLLAHLAPAFAGWEARFIAEGFAPLREEWLAHAARLGETIRARTGAMTREGRFETLDPTGALVLATAGGRHIIPAAEVFFP